MTNIAVIVSLVLLCASCVTARLADVLPSSSSRSRARPHATAAGAASSGLTQFALRFDQGGGNCHQVATNEYSCFASAPSQSLTTVVDDAGLIHFDVEAADGETVTWNSTSTFSDDMKSYKETGYIYLGPVSNQQSIHYSGEGKTQGPPSYSPSKNSIVAFAGAIDGGSGVFSAAEGFVSYTEQTNPAFTAYQIVMSVVAYPRSTQQPKK